MITCRLEARKKDIARLAYHRIVSTRMPKLRKSFQEARRDEIPALSSSSMSLPTPSPPREDDGPAEVLLPQEMLYQFERVNVCGEFELQRLRKTLLSHLY